MVESGFSYNPLQVWRYQVSVWTGLQKNDRLAVGEYLVFGCGTDVVVVVSREEEEYTEMKQRGIAAADHEG
ncbi:hypothetical protein LINGRAHAP2_LOCUS14539 [Linum grandiflorum]